MPASTQQQQANPPESRLSRGPWNPHIGEHTSDALIPTEHMPAELAAAIALVTRACVHAEIDVSRIDLLPTALHVAASDGIAHSLLPALIGLQEALRDHLVEPGPTHRINLARACDAIASALTHIQQLPLPIQNHRGEHVTQALARSLSVPFTKASQDGTATASNHTLLSLHSALKSAALALMALCADLSPPADVPARQASQRDALSMVCCQVLGNDVALTLGSATGQFDTNELKSLVTHNLLQSLRLLADATTVFTEYWVLEGASLKAPIAHGLASSLMQVASHLPHTG